MIKGYIVIFHPRKWGWRLLGHVEIVIISDDDTYAFINPGRFGADVFVEHRFDVVNRVLGARTKDCEAIFVEPNERSLSPVAPLMTCASFVGYLVGFRAFTPAGLRRTLLRNGAKVLKHAVEERNEEDEG